MRFLENLFVKLFSLIVLALSVFLILIGLDIISSKVCITIINFLFGKDLNAKITLISSLVCALVSIKILLTSRRKPKNGKDGIILENANGKLIISKESLDNMISNAAKDIPGAESISSKTYLDLEQNLRVFVTVSVDSNMPIKDISSNLQTKIKSEIKQTADLDVSEVNVQIKSIVNKKAKKVKTPKVKVEEVTNVDTENNSENVVIMEENVTEESNNNDSNNEE